MKSYSIQNTKSFRDKTEIDLKPITLLVGKNSCGKSSLLRFLGVLGQTLGNESSRPLKLFGEYIDYGTFKDVVYNHSEEGIQFSVKFNMSIAPDDHTIGFLKGKENAEKSEKKAVEIITTIKVSQEETIIDSQSIEIDGIQVYGYENNEHGHRFVLRGAYDYTTNSITGSEVDLYVDRVTTKQFFCFPQQNALLKGIKDTYFSWSSITSEDKGYTKRLRTYMYNNLSNKKRSIVHESANSILHSTSIHSQVDPMPIEKVAKALADFDADILSIYSSFDSDRYYKERLKELKKQGYIAGEVEFWDIYTRFLYYKTLIDRIAKTCKSEMKSMSYIGPFRQNPERIYRDAETLPDTVGTKGENTINLLIEDYHHKKGLIEKVSEWLLSTVGYKLIVDNISDGYYQLLLEDNTGTRSNILDVGFGISQVLPIIVQVMTETMSDTRDGTSDDADIHRLSIIEQPELHLHPAAQADLAELFAICVNNSPKQRLLIETHSEHLIRKLQVLVADKNNKLSANDVAVYYVDKDDEGVSNIDTIRILDNGQFEKAWPTGFFDKAFELSMELFDAGS